MSDAVNRPAHYNAGDIEAIDAIRAALGEDGFRAFCRGNAIKYAWRAGRKGDRAQDMAKAAWYSRMASGDDPRKPPLIEVSEGFSVSPAVGDFGKCSACGLSYPGSWGYVCGRSDCPRVVRSR